MVMRSDALIPQLSAQWNQLVTTVGLEFATTEEVFGEIVQAYTQPDRHYHTLAHLAQVLQVIEDLQPYAQHLAAVQFAAWFHDVVYDSHAQDNEAQSAAMAQRALASIGVTENLRIEVGRLILCTQSHHAEPNDGNAQVLLDADLSILSSDEQAYQAYAIAIRQEYHWVAKAVYRHKRRQVLINLLQRSPLYYTPPMQKQTAIAQRNLEYEIQQLLQPNQLELNE